MFWLGGQLILKVRGPIEPGDGVVLPHTDTGGYDAKAPFADGREGINLHML